MKIDYDGSVDNITRALRNWRADTISSTGERCFSKNDAKIILNALPGMRCMLVVSSNDETTPRHITSALRTALDELWEQMYSRMDLFSILKFIQDAEERCW